MYAVAGRLDPDTLLRAGPGDVPRDGRRPGITCGGRVPLPAPPARRDAVRRPERDGARAESRRRGEAGIRIDAAGHLLPEQRVRRRRSRACRCASPTATRRWASGGPSCGQAPRRRRRDPLGPRGAARPAARLHAAGTRCTSTSPSRSPRTRPAWRRTASPRPGCCTTTGAARPATPPSCTPPTSPTTTSRCSASTRHQRLLLPDHRARPRRRHRPGPAAARRRLPAHARQRQPRGHRPVRGDARPGDGRAAGHPGARALDRRRAARGGDRARQPRLRRRRADRGRRRADLVTLDTAQPAHRRHRRRRAHRGRSPPPPPTSPRSSSTVGSCSRAGDEAEIGRELDAAIAEAVAMTSLVVTNIGELVTNDPERRRTCSAWSSDAALVVEGGKVAWVGAGRRRAGRRRAGRRRRPRGAARASSTATATWSSPATGRRSSRPGWPGRRTPPAGSAPRSRPPARPPTSSSPRTSPGLVAEMRRQGTTTVEIKSGYGLTVHDEARSLAVARQFTDETTFLGAHVVPAEYADDPAGYVDLVTGPMLEAAAPHARWIDVFCETRRLRRRPGPRGPRGRRGRRGCEGRLHANQLGPGPGVRLAAELGLAAVDHCTYLDDADVDALRDSGTIATLLPGVEFSTRQPYPDARRLLDAGVAGRAGQRLQPRLLLHQLDAALHRAGGPGDGDDPRRGRARRDVRRRPGARPRRRRRAWPPGSGPTSCCWTPRATSTWPTARRSPGRRHLARRAAGLTPV